MTTETVVEEMAQEDLSMSSKTWAAMGYMWVLCFLPLFLKRDDDYVLFHARQGLLLFVGWCFFLLVSVSPFLGHPLWHLGNALVAVLAAMGIYRAFMGQRWKMPVIGEAAQDMMLS